MTGKLCAAALAVLVAFGCSDPPTTSTSANDDADVGAISFGRGNNNGTAFLLPDPDCGVLDGDGGFVAVECEHQIGTPSRNGNAMVVNKVSGVPNSTGRAVRWDAYNPPQIMLDAWGLDAPPAPCFVWDRNWGATFTLHWSNNVSASGEATLICQYNKNSAYEFPTP
jgi:hypothetical protein